MGEEEKVAQRPRANAIQKDEGHARRRHELSRFRAQGPPRELLVVVVEIPSEKFEKLPRELEGGNELGPGAES